MIIKVLNNGVEIPALGLGTYRLTDQSEVTAAIEAAYSAGYRHFDTAAIYGNHRQLARAFRDLGIKREDIFITSKVWNSDHGRKSTFEALDKALEELQTDYLDLYLIHWPGLSQTYLETWSAMEEIYAKGYVKAIGVSNFLDFHLKKLMSNSEIVPAVNQIELHPYLVDWDLVDFCKTESIAIESWSPIVKGAIATDETLSAIGAKYGKSAVQVTIRWHLQHGFIVIPKSANPERIKHNFDVFDFELTDEDMKLIDSLNKNYRRGPDPRTFF